MADGLKLEDLTQAWPGRVMALRVTLPCTYITKVSRTLH